MKHQKTASFLFILSCFLVCAASCSKEIEPEPVYINIDDLQDLLDSGKTPKEIFDNYKFSGKSDRGLRGYYYEGGVIIQFNSSDGSGIVGSIEDLSDSAWGCKNIEIKNLQLDGFVYGIFEANGFGNGFLNSQIILESACAENSAAKICDDYIHNGFDDWFLPSLGTLAKFEDVTDAKGVYWSSTGYGDYVWQDNLFLQVSSKACAHIINNSGCYKVTDFLGGEHTICATAPARDATKKVRAVRLF